jgi:hypothetical protein
MFLNFSCSFVIYLLGIVFAAMASRLFTSICNSWRNLFPSRKSPNVSGKEKVLPTEVNINEGAKECPNKSNNVDLVPSKPLVNSNKFTDPCDFPDRPTQNYNERVSVRNRGLSSHYDNHNHDQLSSLNTQTQQDKSLIMNDETSFSRPTQRGLFHNIQNHGVSSTPSHVTDRGFPRNLGVSHSSGDLPFHPPIHSTPFTEPQVRFSDQNSDLDLGSTNLYTRKEREPDKFDGKTVEWPDYLRHFEQVALWNRWSEAEKAMQLAMSLRGSAQRILSELSPTHLANYRGLVTSLSLKGFVLQKERAHTDANLEPENV